MTSLLTRHSSQRLLQSHNIPCSSPSALINSSLTTTVGRGTRKNIAEAQAIESAKIVTVSGSVVVEICWAHKSSAVS
jgi:hypothetical protein